MLLVAAVVIAVILFCVWQNGYITVTHREYKSPRVPQALDGFTIVHVSDLHNRRLRGFSQRLTALIRKESPDIIAITGDLIDRKSTDIDAAMEFIRPAAAIAPVYFVSGNHEPRSGQYEALLPRLHKAGVCVLDDTYAVIAKNGQRFIIAGLKDPAFYNDSSGRAEKTILSERRQALQRLNAMEGASDMPPLFLLLSHRPELFSMYVECGVHLVLTGHAHGGQVRLPGVGGLFAPGQGVFPRYTSGVHRRGDTAMVVSRGLGGRFCRLRMFNRPEVVVVKLAHQSPLSS